MAVLYMLYNSELFHVVARHQVKLHMYADDRAAVAAEGFESYILCRRTNR